MPLSLVYTYYIMHHYYICSCTIRFYKRTDKVGKVLHIGTVIEGPHEYKSSRIQNSNRKQTIIDEMLSDNTITTYTKKAYTDIQQQRAMKRRIPLRNGGKGSGKGGGGSKNKFASSKIVNKKHINKLF